VAGPTCQQLPRFFVWRTDEVGPTCQQLLRSIESGSHKPVSTRGSTWRFLSLLMYQAAYNALVYNHIIHRAGEHSIGILYIYIYIFNLSRFCKNIWSGTNLLKIYIWHRGPRRQGHNAVGHGARCRQEWALAWPRSSALHRGVRGLAPRATASGLSAMVLSGSRPPNAVGRGARVPTPI
jgi:hypothetical protein